MAANLQDSLSELRSKKVFLQGLIDAIPDGIRVIDGDYKIVLANRAYREQLAVAEHDPVGMHCYRSSHNRHEPCVPTLVSCPLCEIRQEPKAVKSVHRHICADGKPLAVEVYAAPLVTADTDAGDELIVESVRDLEKLVHFNHERKLTEIGRLASGVAHEIHNPLASVRIALDSLNRKSERGVLEVPAEIKKFLQLVDEEIGQCLDVTERLLKLSMFAGRKVHVVDINRAAADTLSLLDWEAEEKRIEVVTDLAPQGLSILANESDLRMIVLNLAHNAFHAMPDGGRLSLQTCYREDAAELVIADNGVGIPADTIQYVFDPFFSRRADGVEGTGLGLSIVMALVKRHRGSITVVSEPGRGTVFRIVFPLPTTGNKNV